MLELRLLPNITGNIYTALYKQSFFFFYRIRHLWLQHCENSAKVFKKRMEGTQPETCFLTPSSDSKNTQESDSLNGGFITLAIKGAPTSHTGTNARPWYFLDRKLHHDFLTSVASF